MMTRVALAVAVAFGASACAHVCRSGRKQIAELGTPLAHLSKACESALQFGDDPNLDGDALLEAATRDQPDMLTPFAGWMLQAVNVDHHAVVLVCDGPDRALLEDAGCKAPLEADHSTASPTPKCEVTLDVKAVCGGEL